MTVCATYERACAIAKGRGYRVSKIAGGIMYSTMVAPGPVTGDTPTLAEREQEAREMRNAGMTHEQIAATEAAIVRSLPRWVAKALRARGLAWIGMAYVRRNTSMTSQWLPGESVMLITVLHKGVPTARFRVTPVGRFTEIPVDG